jgi:hypothetical protein
MMAIFFGLIEKVI